MTKKIIRNFLSNAHRWTNQQVRQQDAYPANAGGNVQHSHSLSDGNISVALYASI